MANDETKNESQPRSLPPLTSSRPVSGSAKPSLPPLQSSRPTGGQPAVAAPPAPPKPAPMPPAPQAPAAAVPGAAQPAAQATAAVRKPKQDRPPENDQGIWRMNRKNFLNVAGWFAFFSFIITATVGAIRLMVPRVLYEPPSAFKAGYPDDFVIGEVNEKYKDEYRV
jgi:hypothetical protein